MTQTHELWNTLVTTALIGTERQPLVLPNLPINAALTATLAAQFNEDDREGTLLGQAAILSLYRQTGQQPPISTESQPKPCVIDDVERCSNKAGQHLTTLLSGQHRGVLMEWLETLTKVGKRVPEEFLPALLEAGRNQPEAQIYILPVLGQRGRWLAAQNPDWNFAISDPNEMAVWETGSRAARLRLLNSIRSSDTNKAREMLAADWPTTASEERAAFLQTFRVNLQKDDEPFLETALDDKRKEVRIVAAALLAQLPGSALAMRMIQRVAPLLSRPEHNWHLSLINVALPEKCDKTMQRDGVEQKPPDKKIGERAWWLQQMLSIVPPTFWLERWKFTPPELIEAAANNTEWANLLLNGFAQATVTHQDVEMALALLSSPFIASFDMVGHALLKILPPARRESYILSSLNTNTIWQNNSSAFSLLKLCDYQWDVDFSRAVLTAFQAFALTSQTNYAYQAQTALTEAARFFAPELIHETSANWPREAQNGIGWTKAVERFLTVLQFRHDMLEALQ